MKTTRQNISDSRVKLTILLDSNELADGEKTALVRLARDMKAPGFRKGKVPPSVAKKQLDPGQLAMEAADQAISKAVASGFLDNDLQALSRPEVEVIEFKPGESLEFTAEADILPPVTLANYKKLKVKKPEAATVGKAEVEEIVDRIKSQMATKQVVERAAKDGDEVVIDFVGKKDGTAFDGGTATNHEIVLGSHTFIDGFEEGIVGHKAGDTFSLDLAFPKEYRVADLAGADVTFDVTLHEVKELVKPEETDEWAAKVGPYTSAKELRDDIKRELTAQAERNQTEQLRDELVKQTVADSSVEIPSVLRDDQLASIEQDLRQNLMYQGQSFETWLKSQGYDSRDAWAEKEGNAAAEERVKTGLVLAELSKVEKIQASTDEVAARTEAMKAQYASQPEMIRQLAEPDAQRSIANQILTEKTIDRLVELNA
ncbi:MAG TPA: trigger factor [Patescibacteria group bacterium]|jgi:trigger factor|nr:trigger factor [Patescibacteria group bacterium]